jgi:hypothetical protein
MPLKSNIYKKRIAWWLNPWVLAIAAVLILLSIPMVLWIASYNSTEAVMMFVITYLSLLVFVLYRVKISMLEAHLYVDDKEVEKKRKEIFAHRQHMWQNYQKRELEVLQHGDRTTVLDVWRLDPLLLKRHPYFQTIETVMLDPSSHELHIRIQIGIIQTDEINADPFMKKTLSAITSFIRIIIKDTYLQQLQQFFHILAVEVYALREDENHRNNPYPVLSLLFNETVTEQFTYVPSVDFIYLKAFGDLRFNGGLEITPHRSIESLVADSL